MALPDLYNIDGEKMQLGEIVRRCEAIATKDKNAFFVGRETIRGRLRCGVRTWAGLTSPVASRKARVANHAWRDGFTNESKRPRRSHDSAYDAEEYPEVLPPLNELLGR